jgi:hypothetical protein
VTVADVEVGAQRVQIQVELAGRVRTVDHRHDARSGRTAADRPDREDQRGGRGDVAHDQYPRALGHALPELVHQCLRGGDGSVIGGVR